MPQPSRPPIPAGPASASAPSVLPWDWQPDGPAVVASAVSLLQLQGRDSLRFLHGQTSQAIELARPGQWLSTCCLSPTARLRALAEVLVQDDGAWLVIRDGDAAAVRQALDRVLFPADAVTLGSLLPGLLLAPLPSLAAAAEDGAGAEDRTSARVWRPLQGGEGFWLGDQLLLVGASLPGPDVCPADPEAAALLSRPRLEGIVRERWRIQTGWPACPAEVNDDTNPYELGLADRVSLSKGCYIGQETLARLATYDGVRRQLRRWYSPGPVAPAADAVLISADGERAGRITSALALPDGSGWIGLALVRRAALQAESLLADAAEGEPLMLQLSLPERFVAPPVGVGAGAAGR